MKDSELLQNYARSGSDDAFGGLVERYLNLVHSVAMRQVQNAQLAEEVSQAVFILLARKARDLSKETILSAWLFRTTRFVAARARRGEQRRKDREKEAYEMQTLITKDETWQQVAPMLDKALEQLGTTDRNLMLLRFYEGKNHKEAGAALGLTEEAARKRITRAMEKLRIVFARRGTALSVAALASVLAGNAVQGAPAGLAAGVTAIAAKSGAATLPQLVRDTLNAWHWAKVKAAALWLGTGAGAILLLIVAAKYPNSPQGNANNIGNPAPGQSELQTTKSEPASPNAKAAALKPRTLRLHVVEKDSGRPVPGAKLAVMRVPDWTQTYDLATDEEGICDIPLSSDLGRLDVGVLSPGWGARFATWKRLDNDPIPAEYTLRLERVTNCLGGWIRDAKGKAVPDATVWIQFGGTGDASWRETPRERVGVMLPAPVATTDRQGHWTCCVVPEENPGFTLEAKHPDFANTQIISFANGSAEGEKNSQTLQALRAGTLLTVLDSGLELRGRVNDEAGKSIAGAKIVHAPSSDEPIEVQTDANGNFLISKLKPGPFEFAVSADGFAPEYRKVELQSRPEAVGITLKPGAVLRLRVLDNAGNEIPEATVGMEQWGEHRHALNWSGESGPDGRIEWRSAPKEELELFARKEGWCYTRNVRATANGEEHVILMTPELTLSGHVADAETGVSVDKFKVIPGYGEGPGEQVWERGDTRSGTQGSFNLAFTETRQPWRVRIEADGYEPFISEPIALDHSGLFEVAMKRAGATSGIRGVVLQPNGEPAAGARVALLTLDYSVTLRRADFLDQGYGNLTKTDASGKFAFPANPRAHSVAAVGAAGFIKLRVKNPATPVSMRLEPWGTVEGTVAEPVRAQAMEWLCLQDQTALNYRGSVILDINTFQTKPDAEGHFVFRQVPPGSFSLYINRRMGTSMTHQTPVEVRAGEVTQTTIGGKGATVIGKLIMPNGQAQAWDKPQVVALLNSNIQGERPPAPLNLRGDEAGLWAVDYWQSTAAREYCQRVRGFGLDISTNGSFQAEGVPAGNYKLFIATSSASLTKEISIPEPDPPGQVVDLGVSSLNSP